MKYLGLLLNKLFKNEYYNIVIIGNMCQTFSFAFKINPLSIIQAAICGRKTWSWAAPSRWRKLWVEATFRPLCFILLAIRKTLFWQRSLAKSINNTLVIKIPRLIKFKKGFILLTQRAVGQLHQHFHILKKRQNRFLNIKERFSVFFVLFE